MILRIGHRGAAGYKPENTLASFQKALELKVDMIELDVRVCKTGELIVMHSKKVNKTTDGKGHIRDMTLSEIKVLDAGEGEKVPTLNEVLNLIHHRTKVNIEIKTKEAFGLVAKIIENYVSSFDWKYDDFLVSSFDYIGLKLFHKNNQNILIGALIQYSPKNIFKFAKEINAHSINIKPRYAKKEFIKKAHKKGFKIFVFIANKPRKIKKLKERCVDGIFSDFPDRI